jgi:hypothetical protein
VFNANTDQSTKVTNTFATPVSAKYVRIYPVSWNSHISFRSAVRVPCAALEALQPPAPQQVVTSPSGNGDVFLDSYPKGRINVMRDGHWGTVCGHQWSDNEQGASNICKQLGYGGGGTRYDAPSPEGSTTEIVAKNLHCEGGEETIFDCASQANTAECTHANDQGVDCEHGNGDVRLQHYSYPRGRVEIYYNGTWGTLCGHSWRDNEHGAKNICRQLGYEEGTRYDAPWVGGHGQVVTGYRLCSGGEQTIFECALQGEHSDPPPSEQCSHAEDQGVHCTGALRAHSIAARGLEERELRKAADAIVRQKRLAKGFLQKIEVPNPTANHPNPFLQVIEVLGPDPNPNPNLDPSP